MFPIYVLDSWVFVSPLIERVGALLMDGLGHTGAGVVGIGRFRYLGRDGRKVLCRAGKLVFVFVSRGSISAEIVYHEDR